MKGLFETSIGPLRSSARACLCHLLNLNPCLPCINAMLARVAHRTTCCHDLLKEHNHGGNISRISSIWQLQPKIWTWVPKYRVQGKVHLKIVKSTLSFLLQPFFCTAHTSAMSCNVLQCVGMRYNALPRVAIHCNTLPCVAAHCHVLPCAVMRCNVLPCIRAVGVILCAQKVWSPEEWWRGEWAGPALHRAWGWAGWSGEWSLSSCGT